METTAGSSIQNVTKTPTDLVRRINFYTCIYQTLLIIYGNNSSSFSTLVFNQHLKSVGERTGLHDRCCSAAALGPLL